MDMNEEKGDGMAENGMRVRVDGRTHKLQYERGTGDALWRRRGAEEERAVRARGCLRQEERRRAMGLRFG